MLFPIYAVFVWFLAFRWRRNWKGFAAAACGALLGITLAVILPSLQSVLGETTGLRILIWAECALVGPVGLFIASIPSPPRRGHCPYCWYDLSGLPAASVCPECGTPRGGYGTPRNQSPRPQVRSERGGSVP